LILKKLKECPEAENQPCSVGPRVIVSFCGFERILMEGFARLDLQIDKLIMIESIQVTYINKVELICNSTRTMLLQGEKACLALNAKPAD
jgi:hypothetical protein